METATATSVAIDGYMTIKAACKFLAVHPNFIYKLFKANVLPSAKFGRGRRIPTKAVIQYAEKRTSRKWNT